MCSHVFESYRRSFVFNSFVHWMHIRTHRKRNNFLHVVVKGYLARMHFIAFNILYRYVTSYRSYLWIMIFYVYNSYNIIPAGIHFESHLLYLVYHNIFKLRDNTFKCKKKSDIHSMPRKIQNKRETGEIVTNTNLNTDMRLNAMHTVCTETESVFIFYYDFQFSMCAIQCLPCTLFAWCYEDAHMLHDKMSIQRHVCEYSYELCDCTSVNFKHTTI